MEGLIDGLMKLQLTKFNNGSLHDIKVTHINNPHSFYVRLYKFEGSEYLEKLEEPGDPLTHLHTGMNVVYKSNILKKTIRGKIVNIGNYPNAETTSDLFAMDHGFLETSIPIENIYRKKNEIETGGLAIHCKLHQCSPKGSKFDEDAIEVMKYFVNSKRAKILVVDSQPGTLLVQLYKLSDPHDVSTLLAIVEYTNLGYSRPDINRQSRFQADILSYCHKELAVGEKYVVRVQGGDNLEGFFVADVNDYKRLVNSQNELLEHAKYLPRLKLESIKVGNPVGIKPLCKLERAIVTDINSENETVQVMVVDRGNKIQVGYPFLKPLPKFAFEIPVALYVRADEKEVWDNGLHRFLYPGFEFIIEIVSLGHQFNVPHTVKMSSIS